jgi:hypothetical protein
LPVELTDLARAVRVWLNADTVLCGELGRPVPNGFHTGDVRSPGQGAWGLVGVSARNPAEYADRGRVALRLRVVGKAGPESRGPGWEAERAARATAVKVASLTAPARVTLPGGGGVVELQYVDQESIQGPLQTGDVGGELEWTVDAEFHARVVT